MYRVFFFGGGFPPVGSLALNARRVTSRPQAVVTRKRKRQEGDDDLVAALVSQGIGGTTRRHNNCNAAAVAGAAVACTCNAVMFVPSDGAASTMASVSVCLCPLDVAYRQVSVSSSSAVQEGGGNQ